MEANQQLAAPMPGWARVAIWIGAAVMAVVAVLDLLRGKGLEAARGALYVAGILLATMTAPRRRFLRYLGLVAVLVYAVMSMVQVFGHRGR